MTKLTDGKKTVEITITSWDEDACGYTPDCSADFFCVGLLELDEEKNAYIVPDVDYCIEQAQDFQHARGDFFDNRDDCDPAEIESREVWIENV